MEVVLAALVPTLETQAAVKSANPRRAFSQGSLR